MFGKHKKMVDLWNKDTELEFFKTARQFATPEQLFYKTKEGEYFAYWPKSYKGPKSTLQSRNSLIGNFTEKWSVDLLQSFAKKHGLFAVQGAVCEEIGLNNKSSADVAICKTNDIVQKASNIVMLFEVKMSVVWNWKFSKVSNQEKFECVGDFSSHQGNPGLLRSDSMLKAIGKSLNIRVSGFSSSNIPIIVLGNTPINKSYYEKVDYLRKSGIIQGFWSINPKPRDAETLKKTDFNGFVKMDTSEELFNHLEGLLKEKREFFSGMRTMRQLGQIIEIADKENTYEKKAEKFLSLIRTEKNGN